MHTICTLKSIPIYLPQPIFMWTKHPHFHRQLMTSDIESVFQELALIHDSILKTLSSHSIYPEPKSILRRSSMKWLFNH